jgi:hypothetical protein
MVKAYFLEGHDAGGEFLGEALASDFCKDCGSLVNKTYRPKNIGLHRYDYDVCVTNDDRVLVSEKFVNICANNDIEVDFTLINENQRYYYMEIGHDIDLDFESAGVEKFGYCNRCHSFEEVVIRDINSVKIRESISRGVFISKLSAGYRETKTPLTVVGLTTKEILVAGKLKGAVFIPIY